MITGKSCGMEEGSLERVLERARAGDAEAVAELYRQFSRRVFVLCRYLLGSREAAEDATNEVFLRVQRAMRGYDSALPFPRWLLSIASHYCVDQWRRGRLEARVFESESSPGYESAAVSASPLGELLAREERAAVRGAVAALPDRYRLPLVLRYYSELSYDQIAAALGLTRNHVATLIFRAKKELRCAVRPARKERVQ